MMMPIACSMRRKILKRVAGFVYGWRIVQLKLPSLQQAPPLKYDEDVSFSDLDERHLNCDYVQSWLTSASMTSGNINLNARPWFTHIQVEYDEYLHLRRYHCYKNQHHCNNIHSNLPWKCFEKSRDQLVFFTESN